MMRIVVCVKAVPASTEVKMDPATNTIVRDGGAAVLNPFDTAALELAFQVRDVAAASADRGQAASARAELPQVSVLSMGIPATAELLRDCIARGADAAALLTDRAFAGADTLATTHALACGVERLGGADLILCGKMAVDGDTAQIGPELAGALGASCLADVRAIVAVDGDGVVARCGVDGGVATLAASCPVVLTVAKEAAMLRFPSIEGVLDAEDRPGLEGAPTASRVMTWSAADVGADPHLIGLSGSPTQVMRSFVPERERTAIEIAGTAREQAVRLLEIWEGEL